MRVSITGAGVIGPAVMTFYHDGGAVGFPAAIKTFITTLVGLFPDDVTFNVPNGGDTIDDTTGMINGSWATTGGGLVTGTQTVSFTQGAGVRLSWGTGGLVAGRRVKGTTFLVPASGGAFDTTGLVTTATVAAVDSAAAALVSTLAGDLVIWSRPTPTRAGSSHAVLFGTTSRVPTTLRSRRT